MFNPHPPLAGFPFVILVLIASIEALNAVKPAVISKEVANVLLVLLCIISPLTYYAGYWGAEQASQTFTVSEDVIANHQLFAKMYLISLVPTMTFGQLKSRGNSKIILVFYYLSLLLTLTLVSYASFLGGDLVFSHGAGVNVVPD